jgi:hypothetical protein
VLITDKAVVLPLIEENIALNGISHQPTASCSGTAEVRSTVLCTEQPADAACCPPAPVLKLLKR